MNPSDRLVLVGELGPAMYEFDYEWTFRGELVAGTLEDTTTTSTTGRITANVQATRYLVIPPGSLTAGAVYTFILSAAFDSVGLDGCANGDDDGDTCGSSLIRVEMNSPPSSGTFSVEPNEGIVLETRFYFESLG